MDIQDWAFLKENLPFWGELDHSQKKLLESSVTARRYAQGENIHNGQAHCAGLLLLKTGQLRCYLISDTGREITLYHLFERDICLFSASCIMRNIQFDLYIDAEKDCDVLVIPTPVYQQLSESSLAFAEHMSQLLSSRFSEVIWVMEQVLFMSFDRRLALFLLEQSSIEGADTLQITQDACTAYGQRQGGCHPYASVFSERGDGPAVSRRRHLDRPQKAGACCKPFTIKKEEGSVASPPFL